MKQAVESARMGWGLCTVAGVAGKGETLDIVPRFLITGRRVAGSSFGGVKGRDGVPMLVERWLAGDIDAESFISHRITLDEVNRGFELMEAQDGIRSVIALLDDRSSAPSTRSGPRTPTSSPTATAGTACSSTRTASRSRCSHQVEQRGITITHVLVTHQHGDHVVDAHGLAKRFGVQVVGQRADARRGRADRRDVRRRRHRSAPATSRSRRSRRPATAPTTSRCS